MWLQVTKCSSKPLKPIIAALTWFSLKNKISQISKKVHVQAKKLCPIKEKFNDVEKSSSILKIVHKKSKNIHQNLEKKFTNFKRVHKTEKC